MATEKFKTVNPFELFFPEMELAKGSPRFQIIITNCIFELLVNTIIELKCKNAKAVAKYNYSTKLVLLHEMNLITNCQYTFLDAFRSIRNKAAHGAQFNLTEDMLTPFKDMLIRNKREQYYNKDGFHRICLLCLIELWNHNVTIFHPYFNAEIKAENDRQKLIINSLKTSQPL
jgi:hypothetical protein